MSEPGGSERFARRAERPLRREVLIEPLAELGLVAYAGPNDPEPSLVLDGDRVVELDGRREGEWDVLDHFIARNGIDSDAAREAAALPDVEIARRLVDVDAPRAELVRLSRGLSPARLTRIVELLDPVELMFALKKLRARHAPANQAHVTNLKENPALLAADAAEAAARGFSEVETTVGVSRYAPLNALAILVGAQTGRPGVMTQCAVEERLNLRLAIQGLVTYAETLSVYGTEAVFVDGDDTPWSKAFLASAYASRGVKVRFTSGGGSEALMGESEGKSLLYLEARCLAVARAAGSQGVQNGSISCVALALALPRGGREVLAENVLAAWLDLEVASGNDAIASHSEIRKTAKLMGQFLPGTDFVTSGYSSMPRYDNMFGGGNYDSHDYDEWLTMQRDWQVDAGIEPLAEEDALAVRERAARAVQAVFEELGFPAVTDDEVRVAATCLDSRDLPDRDRAADVRAGDRVFADRIGALEVARVLARRGFADVADAIYAMQLQRVSADYLQTAAIIGRDGTVVSAVNAPNDYRGPGTGYRLTGARWERLRRLPHTVDARLIGAASPSEPLLHDVGEAEKSAAADDVVVAVGPAFGSALGETINGLSHADVLTAIVDGIRDGGAVPRVLRVRRSADVAFIGHDGACLAGSQIAVAVQSKGTALIHRADLQPLDNLELFGMAPLLTLESYRQIGVNAAGYALGHAVAPVPTMLDNYARAKLIVRTTLLHAREAAEVVRGAPPVEVDVVPPRPSREPGSGAAVPRRRHDGAGRGGERGFRLG
ncbi:MAG: propanediol/glycerol family dehydratase large subunit [Gaiellaceae bacterium]